MEVYKKSYSESEAVRRLYMAPAKIDSRKETTFTLSITEQEAYAFAQFLKRVQFDDFRRRAVDDEDAYEMQAAAGKIRNALAEAGFSPR